MPPVLAWCSHTVWICHLLTFPHGCHLPIPCQWPITVLLLLYILAFNSQISSIILGNISDPANNQSSSPTTFTSSPATTIYCPGREYHPILLHHLTTASNHPINYKFLLMLLSTSYICLTLPPLPCWFRPQQSLTWITATASLRLLQPPTLTCLHQSPTSSWII